MAEPVTFAPPAFNIRAPHRPSSSPSAAQQNLSKPLQTAAVTKRKQSKSRNGCVTCKAKRLKCDETKPTCAQCARRSVACGGYKKDFKWRAFEEPHVPGKPPAKLKKETSLSTSPLHASTFPLPSAFQEAHYNFSSPAQHDFYSQPPPQHLPPSSSFPTRHVALPTSYPPSSFSPDHLHPAVRQSFSSTPRSISPTESYTQNPPDMPHEPVQGGHVHAQPVKVATPSSAASPGQSPRLVDLLLPGTDLNVPPAEYSTFLSQHEAFYQPTGLTPPAPADDLIEEIARIHHLDHKDWGTRPLSPDTSDSSDDSPELRLVVQPQFSLASPEYLLWQFDTDTCGVLSVKDGPTENPWRTLIWPLARDCPALYHAISSMTSFHHCTDIPVMRIHGIDHMRNAVHSLAAGLQDMRVDAAISTTLVLAFSESWDQHISTGINHIKGAKLLINQALLQHTQSPKKGDDWTRLKFLCNTWIYMDVIARLTSADEDETNEVDAIQESIYAAGEDDAAIDPLMGCAQTLFPIIGRVANLVRKVRRTKSNGPSIISQAVQLKSQLEDWIPPSFIEDPEDETTSPTDSIKTAMAYQYATLLYLHQAVPEVPSQASSVLAKKVLCELATVEPRSRSIIVQIYPLMAAGCEATDEEDREWVKNRWASMIARMKLGILERCLEVTKEVWARRDAHTAEQLSNEQAHVDMRNDSFCPSPHGKRDFESAFFEDFEAVGDFSWLDGGPKRRAVDGSRGVSLHNSSVVDAARRNIILSANTELLKHDFTVKGRAHWLGVMKEWNWEVLLG